MWFLITASLLFQLMPGGAGGGIFKGQKMMTIEELKKENPQIRIIYPDNWPVNERKILCGS